MHIVLLLALVVCAGGVITEEYVAKAIVELSAANVTRNLKEWDTDLVIMFYAPWCKYCKQLLPTWGTIATLKEDNNEVTVGKFDCEESERNTDICRDFNVDRYPSIYFVGYGDFNQADGGTMIGAVSNPRVVRYVADLYPEAIFDWVNMLTALSGWHRRWDDFVGFFTGKSRAVRQVARLKSRTEAAERKAELFGKELERYKANELFDELEDHGDPFPLLSSLEPDEVCWHYS
jgi:thiol-disulfide isomerase/thioredoxin